MAELDSPMCRERDGSVVKLSREKSRFHKCERDSKDQESPAVVSTEPAARAVGTTPVGFQMQVKAWAGRGILGRRKHRRRLIGPCPTYQGALIL